MEKQILEKLTGIEIMLTGQKAALTFDEAARFTGLSKSYLYKLTSSGKVPFYKPHGKMLYFDRAELEKWLLKNQEIEEAIEGEAATYVTLGKRGGQP